VTLLAEATNKTSCFFAIGRFSKTIFLQNGNKTATLLPFSLLLFFLNYFNAVAVFMLLFF